ncbi:MAG: hypothetical protein E7165_01860 [Firmicutes bacterium]|nr:hypothetical protein [Bacillota bacterium]
MIGILILTLLALLLSVILVTIDYKLNRRENKEDEFRKLLPGYNCGACGYGSCDGMAKAMLEEIQNYKKCKPLRGDALKEMEAYVRKIKQ